MTGRIHDKIFEASVLAILVITPLVRGSVYEWTYRLVAAVSFLLLASWLYRAGRKRGFTYTRTPLVLLLPLTAAFVLIQLTPLPVTLIHALSPGRAALDSAAGFTATVSALSLYPWAAADRGLFILSIIVLFLLVLFHSWSREGASRVVYLVVALGTLFSVVSLARSGDSTVERHFWPYVNKNHFAGYLEAAISIAAASILYRERGAAKEKRVRGALRSFIRCGWRSETAWMSLSVAVMFAGLLMSVSRGGLIGLAAGLLVIAATSLGVRRRAALVPVAAMLLVVLGLAALDESTLSSRLGRLANVTEDGSAMLRLDIWKDTAEMIKGAPVTGVGLGGYETAYQYYKTVKKYTIIFQPESDYLYVLAEGGLIGFSLAAAFAALVLLGLVRASRLEGDAGAAGMSVGVLAATAALLVHGFVDTNLHMPANALLVAVLAAVVLSPGVAGGGGGGDKSGAAKVYLRGRAVRAAVYAAAFVSLMAAAYAAAGALADIRFMNAMQEKETLAKSDSNDPLYMARGYEDIIECMNSAAAFDLGRIDYPFEKGVAYNSLGRLVERLGSEKADDMGLLLSSEYYGLAYREFIEASQRNPYNSFAHLLAGRALEDGLGDMAGGEKEYLAAERLNPTNRLIKQVLIGYYKKKGDRDEAHRREVDLAVYDPVNNRVRVKSLVPDTAGNTAVAGDRVTWTAKAEIITGRLEYKFCLKRLGDVEYVDMTEYGPSNTWTWDTSSYGTGKYRVLVKARGAGGGAEERVMAYKGDFVLTGR
ncbi:MAG: O-antigen ligase family protein [Nitrospirae bacterium]|nr:O-antigen ligase family protein [Nitrospirota bacterium]